MLAKRIDFYFLFFFFVMVLLTGCASQQNTQNPDINQNTAVATDNPQIIELDQVTDQETEEAQTDVTDATDTVISSYTPYTNSKRGYSLEYPTDWRIDETLDDEYIREVSFRGPEAEGDDIYFSVALDSGSLQEFQDLYAFSSPTAKLERTTFSGHEALLYTFSENPGRQEMIVDNGDAYIIFTEPTNKTEVQHMLATFTFLK